MWRLGMLCGIAGYVDGWGYTQVGRVFAANMTGNTVLFGIALAEGEWLHALSYATTLAAFFLAGIVASLIRRETRRSDLILYGAAGFLLLALIPHEAPDIVLALLAVAMAFEGTAVQRFGRTTISTVVVTNTLLRLAEGIVTQIGRPAHSPVRPEEREVTAMGAIAWTSYALGGAMTIGGAAYLTRWALVPPALLLVGIAATLPRDHA